MLKSLAVIVKIFRISKKDDLSQKPDRIPPISNYPFSDYDLSKNIITTTKQKMS